MRNYFKSCLLTGVCGGTLVAGLGYVFSSKPLEGTLVAGIGYVVIVLLYIGGGILATWHSTDVNSRKITGLQGLCLGALTGVTMLAMHLVINFIGVVVGILPSDSLDRLRAVIRQEGVSPEAVFVMASIVVFLQLVLYGIMGGTGGAVGSKIFKIRKKNVSIDKGVL